MSEPKSTISSNASTPTTTIAQSSVHLPRIAIKFCTQCKWNLRAAYYAQELLQTFSTTLGEVSLIPSSGGIFTITLFTALPQPTTPSTLSPSTTNPSPTNPSNPPISILSTQIWNRTTDNGFPETKELKSRVRNIIDPERDLGHVDRSLKKEGRMKATMETETEKGIETEKGMQTEKGMKAAMEMEMGMQEKSRAEVPAGLENSSVAGPAGESTAGKPENADATTQNRDVTTTPPSQNAKAESVFLPKATATMTTTTTRPANSQKCEDCP